MVRRKVSHITSDVHEFRNIPQSTHGIYHYLDNTPIDSTKTPEGTKLKRQNPKRFHNKSKAFRQRQRLLSLARWLAVQSFRKRKGLHT